MNPLPSPAAGDGAALAAVLAEALSLGLPCPDYITISPSLAGSERVSAIGFQFNACHGQDPLPALTAWADRFGAAVDVEAESKDPASAWHEFDFTHAGVLFRAYATIRDAAQDDGGPLRIAPGGSAGPASLASVAVLPSGFVTADAPVLRGARIGGGA